MAKVERTIRLATIADTMTDAWTFIMSHLEDVGPGPSVSITPMWVYDDDGESTRRFDVAVSGMVEIE